MSLENKQVVLLDNLIYLDESVVQNNLFVGDVVDKLLKLSDEEFKAEVTDPQFYYCNNMVNGMNPDQ